MKKVINMKKSEVNKINVQKVLKGEDIKVLFYPIEYKLYYSENNWETLEEEKQKAVLKWVRQNLKQKKTINYRHTSYGLKHLCERMVGFYVHNDVMKKALILEGYKVDTFRNGQLKLNWFFNISETSIKETNRKKIKQMEGK